MNYQTRFRRDIMLLICADLFWGLGSNLFAGLLPVYIREFTDNVQIIGFLMSVTSILAFTSIIGGFLARKIHVKYVIVFGWLITVPAPLFFMHANGWQMILVGLILQGLTSVSAASVVLYIFEYPYEGNKMNAYMNFSMGIMIGALIAPSIGGIVAEQFGIRTIFFLTFVLWSVASVCTILLTKYEKMPVETLPAEKTKEKQIRSEGGFLARMGLTGPILLFIILMCLLHFGQNIAQSVVALYLDETRNFSLRTIGFATTFLSLGGIVMMWFSKRFNARIGMGKTVVILSTIFILANFGMALTGLVGLMAAMLLRGVLSAMPNYVQAKVSDILPEKNRGVMVSLYMTARSLVIAAGTNFGAGLYTSWPYLPFLAEIVIMVLWIVAYYALRHKFDFLLIEKNNKTAAEKS